ncbi:IMPACT family protein [Specibacter cremeus]|uniref:IMPACT family protein n=1 Tax=Specibacter cremeus TaxID=1629051 RepID=UPI001F0C1866|nr:YigZ family protein [Specibacter cremeus]
MRIHPPAAVDRPAAYTTLAPGAGLRHELVIKRSRFITVLRRVEDEAGARALVAELRREFHDARHHCSAFVLGPDRGIQRSNDDGEPSGTAGMPMLDALLKRETRPGTPPAADLSDVCAVVVRYFGGVLLGAGGLVRAYSDSVSAALDAAVLVRRSRLRLFTVAVPHADAGRLEHELHTAGYTMTGNGYDARRTLVGLAVADDAGTIAGARARLASLTAGAGELVDAGTDWVDTPVPG